MIIQFILVVALAPTLACPERWTCGRGYATFSTGNEAVAIEQVLAHPEADAMGLDCRRARTVPICGSNPTGCADIVFPDKYTFIEEPQETCWLKRLVFRRRESVGFESSATVGYVVEFASGTVNPPPGPGEGQ